jgi:vitamin B12 transporter
MRLIEEVHSKLTILSVREWESFQTILRSLGRRSGLRARKEKAARSGGLSKKFVGVALMMVILFVVAGRIEANEDGGEAVATMAEVVVTATRTESGLDKVGGSSVTVITAEEIERKKHTTVAEVLKGVVGLHVTASGGPGTKTTVFTRGMDSRNTLVLLDGIMFNDPSSDRNADLANLTVDNIERIEIVRGPMSVLYGSNATAGVINIITRKGDGRPTAHIGLEGGSEETWKVFADYGGKVKSLDFSVAVSRTETEGFSVANDDNDRIVHAGNTDEKDGWENTTLSGKFGFEINSDFVVSAVVRYMDSMVEEDDWGFGGFAGDRFNQFTGLPEPNGLKERRTEGNQLFTRLNIHNSFGNNKFTSDLSWQTADQERDSFDNDGILTDDYNGESTEVNWQGGTRVLENNVVTVGAGYFEERMDNHSIWGDIEDKSAETVSYWVQDQLFMGDALDIVIGARIDDHDLFGSEFTYRIAPAYTINATNTKIKANYGTGLKAPSLYELYSVYGNENLQAEESVGWDVGVEQELLAGKIRFGITYFEVKIQNRIGWLDLPSPPYGMFIQVPGDTHTNGIETEIDYSPTGDLEFRLTYTYNDTEDPDGKRLVRRPLNEASLSVYCSFIEQGQVSADIQWVGERESITFALDKDGNSVNTLDSYLVVNLAAKYDLSDTLQLYGRIDNLFDEEYEEAWSYATPGLAGYLGLRVSY